MIRNWFKPRSDSIQQREVLTKDGIERSNEQERTFQEVATECISQEAQRYSRLPKANTGRRCVKCGSIEFVRKLQKMDTSHTAECSIARSRSVIYSRNCTRSFTHAFPDYEVLRVSCANCAHHTCSERPLDAEVEEP